MSDLYSALVTWIVCKMSGKSNDIWFYDHFCPNFDFNDL